MAMTEIKISLVRGEVNEWGYQFVQVFFNDHPVASSHVDKSLTDDAQVVHHLLFPPRWR